MIRDDAASKRRQPVAQTILQKLCDRRGATLFAEPDFGYAGFIENAAGERSFFRGAAFDINAMGAASIARDKSYTGQFLREAGLVVPEDLLICSPRLTAETRARSARMAEGLKGTDDALTFARQIGFPVYVKPNDSSEGRGVSRATSEQDLSAALESLYATYDRILVQKAATGREYRILMLDGDLLAVFERRPFSVIGDGTHTIRELITARTSTFVQQGDGARIRPEDARITARLVSLGLGLDSVLQQGNEITLLANANLSAGGVAIDVTTEISARFVSLARKAGKTIGLRFFGLDLLADDISAETGDYAILELNAAPGLSHFYHQGEREAAKVEEIYEHLFDHLMQDLDARQ